MKYPVFCTLFLLIILTGCGTARYSNFSDSNAETITQSLFEYKDRTISESDVLRILDGKINVKDTLRVAVYRFGGQINRRFSHNSIVFSDETRIKTNQQIMDTLVTYLRTSNRVYKVNLMPMMVTGGSPNINLLREAAVRLQSDMLLVFNINSDLYQQYRTFKKDDVKAYATCESILMDVRTGIIPHSSVVTREAYGKKSDQDLNLDEARTRIQNQAIMLTMLETGTQAATFLGKKD